MSYFHQKLQRSSIGCDDRVFLITTILVEQWSRVEDRIKVTKIGSIHPRTPDGANAFLKKVFCTLLTSFQL
ncbi:hypothetical protein BLOT_002223 [Blomia tropicalis]|nr:hypothetical protein BLOT_002223 [Blomia tropicalis]